MKRIALYVFLACVVLPFLLSNAAAQDEDERPEEWAEPIELDGAPNLHRVDERLYRGAQPDEDGFEGLHDLGVRTVVNLRSFHSDRDEIGELPLAYEHIYMKAWHPEEEEILRFLQIATDPRRRPIFVHCQHGADRTGTMCAIYRVVVEDWPKEDAIREMRDGGYGFHGIFQNLIDFIEDLDCEALEEQLERSKRRDQDEDDS
jgi:protein tyrosine phosphatase (PTP) superfamily phosphohydrolase (DUF442 family)